MKIPLSLTSRVTTLANRRAPRVSFHVTRAGKTSERRSDLRGVMVVLVVAVLSAGIMGLQETNRRQTPVSIDWPTD
jgi:hypothetical protein